MLRARFPRRFGVSPPPDGRKPEQSIPPSRSATVSCLRYPTISIWPLTPLCVDLRKEALLGASGARAARRACVEMSSDSRRIRRSRHPVAGLKGHSIA